MKRNLLVLALLAIPLISHADILDGVLGKGKIYKARTDTAIVQPLIPPPSMGGSVGMNNTVTDSRYSNVRYLRVTDSLQGNGNGKSWQSGDTGEDRDISSDDLVLIPMQVSGGRSVFVFDPNTFTVKPTTVSLPGPTGFSWKSPRTLFSLSGTQISKIVLSQDATQIVSQQVIFDYASQGCLGQGFTATWNGSFLGPKRDDQTFVVAFSSTGGQGSGHLVAAYNIKKGCRVLDTVSGQITGQWGKTGPMDDGVNPWADRFYLHAAGAGSNPSFTNVGMTDRQPGGASGCVAGNCANDNPYYWEVATTHLRSCGASGKCDGHESRGFLNTASGKHMTLHQYANPLVPLTKLFPGNLCSDEHGSWNNSGLKDQNPSFYTTALVSTSPVTNYTCAYENEIFASKSDGSGVVYRFAQTLNSGASPYYAVQNAQTNVSDDGNYALFPSDWMQTLGVEKDGQTYRSDVFLIKLK